MHSNTHSLTHAFVILNIHISRDVIWKLFLIVYFFCRRGTIQIYLVPLWRHWNIQQCSACRLECEPCMTQNSAHLCWNVDCSEESSEVKPSGRHAANLLTGEETGPGNLKKGFEIRLKDLAWMHQPFTGINVKWACFLPLPLHAEAAGID